MISVEGKISTYNKEYEIVEYADGKPVIKKINLKKQTVHLTDVKPLAYSRKNKGNKEQVSDNLTEDTNIKSIEEFI